MNGNAPTESWLTGGDDFMGGAIVPAPEPAPVPAPATYHSAPQGAAPAAPAAAAPAAPAATETPPVAPPPSSAAAPPVHGYAPAYGGEIDPRVHRLVREQARKLDELKEIMEDLAPKMDVVEEKLLGGRRKDRRSKAQQGIAPLEMLACLQTVVDEHRMMEAESLSKDEELAKVRKELTEAIERQSSLIQEKHDFLKQQNALLIGQQADQKTLVELQHVRESHTRDIAELNSQLASALEKAAGMSTVDTEMSRLRMEHGAAVASLSDQLMLKEADIAEATALVAETKRDVAAKHVSIESTRQQAAELQAKLSAGGSASVAAAGSEAAGGGDETARAAERAQLQATLDEAQAEHDNVVASIAASESELQRVNGESEEEHAKLAALTKQRDELRTVVAQAEGESEAHAREKVKQILQKVYATLGEEFVDGEDFDGAVVRGAIKRSILQAMKS